MSSLISEESKTEVVRIVNNNRFLLSLIDGILITLLLGIFLKTWLVILLSGIVCGLYYEKVRMGLISGFLANFLGWLIFLLYYMVFFPSALVMGDVFLSLAGAGGLGFIVIILTLVIGGIGGLIGGYIGSAIHPFVPWPKWDKSLS
ncbi:MAG: hypothetical protein ACW981_03720 [Candidatus Hodarchaeales archaeon]